MISEKEAIQIAFEAAKKDEFDRFPNPHLKSAVKKSGKWTIHMLSNAENNDGAMVLGAYYLYVIIDGSTGKIIKKDAGGGS